jgi:hypothetical protein
VNAFDVVAGLDPAGREFYRRVLESLERSGIPYLLGGAYAFSGYTGIARHTKDLDVFLREADVERALAVLEAEGYPGEMTFAHWLAKARHGDYFVDLIFSSGNGVAVVDDGWFDHATEGEALGVPVLLCPVEEMIWSKAFIMERERFDGADVLHLILARGETMDWKRLLERFGPNWRVLLSHLILFNFVYPFESGRIPAFVLADLLSRLRAETALPPNPERVCRGTLLSRSQYLVDIGTWGYEDARVVPTGSMKPDEVERWTAGIDEEGPGSTPVPTGDSGAPA